MLVLFNQETPSTSCDTEGPPKKKVKGKETRLEGALSNMMASFAKQQEASPKMLMEWQERQSQKEAEREERQRQEDRQHDLQLFGMFGQLITQMNQAKAPSNIHFGQDGLSYMNL